MTAPDPSPSAAAPKPRRLLPDLLLLLLLACLGVAGYKLAPLLTPRSDVQLPLSACDLGRDTCSVALPGGGNLEFALSPRPVPALKPLQLSVVTHGVDARGIEVDFSGVDMQMGYNRIALAALGDGRWSGNADLPVCITGSMQWRATLIVDAGRESIAAPFAFTVSAH